MGAAGAAMELLAAAMELLAAAMELPAGGAGGAATAVERLRILDLSCCAGPQLAACSTGIL
jgi:hypothetical protein